MHLEKELLCFTIILFIGAWLYVGFGDYALNIYEERNSNRLFLTEDLGLDYYLVVRFHFVGLFIGCIGIIGLIVKFRSVRLIS